MRKTQLNNRLHAAGHPLDTFADARLANNFADAREAPAGQAFKVGDPNGVVRVPGKRSWIYIQRLLPDGSAITMQCFVPSNSDGEPHNKFLAGQVIMPRWSNDTQPGYYYYTGVAPSARASARVLCDTPSDPDEAATPLLLDTRAGAANPTDCVQSAFVRLDDGNYRYNGSFYTDTLGRTVQTTVPKFANFTGFYDPATHSFQSVPPPQPNETVPVTDPADVRPSLNLTSSTNYLDLAYQGAAPPNLPIEGSLWDDGRYLRRYDATVSVPALAARLHWRIVRGPTSGVFADYTAAEDLARGEVAYQDITAGPSQASLASYFNDNCQGRVLGIVEVGAAAGGIATIQLSGFMFFGSFDPGVPFFLGAAGELITVCPPVGSDVLAARLGLGLEVGLIKIEAGPALKRAYDVAVAVGPYLRP
jgi:hypothetical protein